MDDLDTIANYKASSGSLDDFANYKPAPAAAPAAPVAPPSGWDRALEMAKGGADVFGHHLSSFFHHGAQTVEDIVASAADKLDPKYGTNLSSLVNGQPQRSGWNQAIHNTVNQDAQAMKTWEQDYQDRTKNVPLAITAPAAVAGEVLPFLNPANDIAQGSRWLADKSAPLVKRIFSEGAAPAVTSAVRRGTEGAAFTGLYSGFDPFFTGVGAGISVAAPPVVSKAYNFATAGRTPEIAAANSVADLVGQKVTPAELEQRIAQAKGVPIEQPVPQGVPSAAAQMPPQTVPQGASVPQVAPRPVPQPVTSPRVPQTPQQSLADYLRNYRDPVPGVTPSTAQALSPVLGPEGVPLVQLENAMTNTQSGKLAQATNEVRNNAARYQHINQFDVAPEDFGKLVQDRRDFARQAWEGMKNPVQLDPVLQSIDEALATSTAVKRSSAAESALRELRANILKDAGEGGTVVDPSHLDARLGGVNELLSKHAPDRFGAPTVEDAGLAPVVRQIRDSIQATNPGYSDYLSGYAAKSTPINTATLVRDLFSSDTGVLGKGSYVSGATPQITLPAINSALKRATSQEYPVSPQLMDALRAVQQSLKNRTVSDSIRSAGSPTFYNQQLGQALENAVTGRIGAFDSKTTKGLSLLSGAGAGTVVGHAFGGLPGGAAGSFAGSLLTSHLNGLFGSASQRLGANAQQAYIDALMNPEVMGEYLSRAAKDSDKSPLVRALTERLK